MATLTGELISETYDSLLKVTDNNTITGIKKRITDGFGNEIPLLLSSTELEIDGKLILSALSDLEAGEKFLILYPDNSVGYRTSLEVLSDIGGASASSISGTINQIAKFDTAGSVTNSIITEVSDKIGIDLISPNNKLSVNIDGANTGIDLQFGSTSFARFGVVNPGTPGDPGVDNDCYIGSTINNDFLIRVNNTEALRIDTALRLKIANIQNATVDTDKFLVSDDGVVKYRSGLEMLSDLGAVPYTGATNDVDLGVHDLTANAITLDPTPTTIPTAQGSMYFDSSDQTVATILNGTIMKIGEDLFFQIKNQSGATIPKGTAVRFDGVLGSSGRVLAVPFLANGSVPSIYFLGVTSEDIPNGGDGKAFYFGKIRGINTNAYPAGTILYASTTVAGGFQTTAPTAPNNIISVAAVVTQGTSNGTILVRPLIGSNINNDEGVKITSPTTGDLLQLQSSGLWENKSANNAGLVTLAGTQTITGAKTFTNGITLGTTGVDAYTISADGLAKSKFNFNGKSFIFDASTIPVLATLTYSMPSSSGTLALTSQLHDAVTIGTANGLSLSGQVLSLGLASSSTNGALSSTDWTTFNNKANANGSNASGTWAINISGNAATATNADYANASGTSNTTSAISGTTSYIPKFTSSNIIGNSQLYETASGINIGSTINAGYKLDVNGTGRFSDTVKINRTLSFANGTYTTQKLQITGSIGINSDAADTVARLSLIGDSSSGDGIIDWGGNGNFNLRFTNNGNTRLTIASTGAATFSSSVTGKFFKVNGTNGVSGYLLQQSDWTGVGVATNLSLAAETGNGISFYTNGDASNLKMFINTAGNVGIGTTSPASKLHIVTPAGADFQDSISLEKAGGYGNVILQSYYVNVPNYGLGIKVGDTTRMVVNGAGNVGIGTTSPNQKLHIAGILKVAPTTASSSGVSTLILSNDFDNDNAIRHTSDKALAFETTGSERMRITSGGNVGIGTTSPSYQLQLSTDSAAKPSTNTWTISSDARIKENINPYTKGLDVLMAINPVTYDYNGKAGFEKIKGNIGIIAQDVLNLLPESISTYKAKLNDDDLEETELYNFNSHALTYVLINAIKELNEKITQLENK